MHHGRVPTTFHRLSERFFDSVSLLIAEMEQCRIRGRGERARRDIPALDATENPIDLRAVAVYASERNVALITVEFGVGMAGAYLFSRSTEVGALRHRPAVFGLDLCEALMGMQVQLECYTSETKQEVAALQELVAAEYRRYASA